MFTFHPSVPTNIRAFLSYLVAPWIQQRDRQLFALDTVRFGLVTFRRDPWPPFGDVNLVMPAGEVDLASLQSFSATF